MSWEWLVVLVIMLAMNIFLFLVFWTTRQRAESQVRDQFFRKLEDMHSLATERVEKLESTERSLKASQARLDDLAKEEQEKKKQSWQKTGTEVLQPLSAVRVSSAHYRNTEAKEQYRYIKEHLAMNPDQIVRELLPTLQDTASESAVYADLAARFSFEDRYELLTLSTEEQRQVLDILLNDSEKKILEEYQDRRNPEGDRFDALGFFDYVESQAKLRDGTVWVYTGDSADPLTIQDERVRWKPDPTICEGCRVQYRDQIYDYSL